MLNYIRLDNTQRNVAITCCIQYKLKITTRDKFSK